MSNKKSKPAGKPAKMPVGFQGWNLLDGERGMVTLKDVLHNLSARENADNHQYGQGVLVGVVCTLCACGMEYDDATQLAWQLCPSDIHPERVPESWRDRFGGKYKK